MTGVQTCALPIFPVLLDHGSVWTEAPAILLHLALAHPECDLAPKGSGELCRTVEWCNWLSGTVHSTAVRLVWRPESFTTEPDGRDGLIKKGCEQIDEAHRLIEARLTEGAWAMPSGYTVLDPYLLVFYRWGNRMGLPMSTTYPRWTAHTDKALTRQAVRRALEREEISVWQ